LNGVGITAGDDLRILPLVQDPHQVGAPISITGKANAYGIHHRYSFRGRNDRSPDGRIIRTGDNTERLSILCAMLANTLRPLLAHPWPAKRDACLDGRRNSRRKERINAAGVRAKMRRSSARLK
jgi:hypothetical protein